MYETIQTPFNYGGLTLKNRIIFAPTTFGLSDEDYFEKIRRSPDQRYQPQCPASQNHFLTKKALHSMKK